MMFKRKENPREYRVDNLGALIVERTQMPHSYTNAEGDTFEVLSWIIMLRINDGPVLFERTYTMGEQESFNEVVRFINLGTRVEGPFQAEMLFYRELYSAWGSR